jgi:putative SOS response-associated peptidase YedK
MCNLYSITRNQAAIRDLFKVARDTTGNLPPLPANFPDQVAPVVRVNEGERELTMMRWGMPNPPQHPGITTNIRNTGSPHWRRWLAPESRCLVPMSSFCEYADTKPKKTPRWFAIDESRPLVAFAGIWTEWTGVRGTKAKSRAEELQYSRRGMVVGVRFWRPMIWKGLLQMSRARMQTVRA